MKTKSLVIGYVFALALLLFAQRHRGTAEGSGIHAVVDLSRAVDSPVGTNHAQLVQAAYRAGTVGTEVSETLLEAPAKVAPSLWTVDQIPPERLIAPLVVFDVRNRVIEDPGYQLTVLDIASWERSYGEIPLGCVVTLLTGRNTQKGSGYSVDAAKFLIEGREAVGLGTDANYSAHDDSSNYALLHSAYLLYGVSNLDRIPATGGVAMVAPAKLRNRTDAPVRILAMLK